MKARFANFGDCYFVIHFVQNIYFTWPDVSCFLNTILRKLVNTFHSHSLTSKGRCNRQNRTSRQTEHMFHLAACMTPPNRTFGNHKTYHNTKLPIISFIFLSDLTKKLNWIHWKFIEQGNISDHFSRTEVVYFLVIPVHIWGAILTFMISLQHLWIIWQIKGIFDLQNRHPYLFVLV